MSLDLKKIIQTRLNRILTEVKSGSLQDCRIINFRSGELRDESRLKKIHDKFDKESEGFSFLYIIKSKQQGRSCSRIRSAYQSRRNLNLENMSRDNDAHPASDCLYVGASNNPHSRFRTHLGMGEATQTWALYMSRWAITTRSSYLVSIYKIRCTSTQDMELIESIVWDNLKPMFGKKGGR